MDLKDKVPPHNLVAEQATLGALLLDWDALGNVISYLRPERFYSLQNQKIFEAILSLDGRGIRGDIVTLIDELRNTGNLDYAGGPAYVSSLTDTVPTSANVEYYAKIVFDEYIRREVITLSSKSISEAHNETIESEFVLEEAQKRIFELSDSKQSQNVQHVQNLIGPVIENIERIYKNKKELVGIPSGFTDFVEADLNSMSLREIGELIDADGIDAVHFSEQLTRISKVCGLSMNLTMYVDKDGNSKDLDDNAAGTMLYGRGYEIRGAVVVAMEDSRYGIHSFDTEEDIENVYESIDDMTGGLLSRETDEEDGRYDAWA